MKVTHRQMTLLQQYDSQGRGSISLMSLGVAPFDRHKAVILLLMFEILFHFPNKSNTVACGLVFLVEGGV